MAKQSKTHVDRQIRSLHEAGSGPAAIAATLTADGTPMSRQGVYKALKRLGLVDGAPDETVLPTPEEIEAGTDPESLADWHALAAEAASAARQRRDPVALARFVGLGTAIQAQQRKNEPPPAVDPNTRPDVVEAAKRCREKIFGLFDRLVAEAEGKS